MQTGRVSGAPAAPLWVCDSEPFLCGISGSIWHGPDVAGAVLGFASVSCCRRHLAGQRGGGLQPGSMSSGR